MRPYCLFGGKKRKMVDTKFLLPNTVNIIFDYKTHNKWPVCFSRNVQWILTWTKGFTWLLCVRKNALTHTQTQLFFFLFCYICFVVMNTLHKWVTSELYSLHFSFPVINVFIGLWFLNNYLFVLTLRLFCRWETDDLFTHVKQDCKV
jgi:hypothetical protein